MTHKTNLKKESVEFFNPLPYQMQYHKQMDQVWHTIKSEPKLLAQLANLPQPREEIKKVQGYVNLISQEQYKYPPQKMSTFELQTLKLGTPLEETPPLTCQTHHLRDKPLSTQTRKLVFLKHQNSARKNDSFTTMCGS